jgi:hypothetical protein
MDDIFFIVNDYFIFIIILDWLREKNHFVIAGFREIVNYFVEFFMFILQWYLIRWNVIFFLEDLVWISWVFAICFLGFNNWIMVHSDSFLVDWIDLIWISWEAWDLRLIVSWWRWLCIVFGFNLVGEGFIIRSRFCIFWTSVRSSWWEIWWFKGSSGGVLLGWRRWWGWIVFGSIISMWLFYIICYYWYWNIC